MCVFMYVCVCMYMCTYMCVCMQMSIYPRRMYMWGLNVCFQKRYSKKIAIIYILAPQAPDGGHYIYEAGGDVGQRCHWRWWPGRGSSHTSSTNTRMRSPTLVGLGMLVWLMAPSAQGEAIGWEFILSTLTQRVIRYVNLHTPSPLFLNSSRHGTG